VDDDPYQPVFSLFMVFWGVLFLSCWERRSRELACDWGVASSLSVESKEEVRPGFHGTHRISRITSLPEVYFPSWKRCFLYLLSSLITGFMLLIAFLVMVCSLNLQGYIKDEEWTEKPFYLPELAKLAEEGEVFDPNTTVGLTPTVLHVIVILGLNSLYRLVAEQLTEWENHRTEEDHEQSLIIKRFFFEAFDCYIALFYLAFAQFNLSAVRVELISLYSTDQFRRVFLEAFLPYLLNLFNARSIKKDDEDTEDENQEKKEEKIVNTGILRDLMLPEYEAFDDYLEMVIEFGYLLLFASAFPLASCLSLLCHLVEIKSDLFKVTRVVQRPLPRAVDSIGPWQTVLKVQTEEKKRVKVGDSFALMKSSFFVLAPLLA